MGIVTKGPASWRDPFNYCVASAHQRGGLRLISFPAFTIIMALAVLTLAGCTAHKASLLNPNDKAFSKRAPAHFFVLFETTQGQPDNGSDPGLGSLWSRPFL